MKRQLVWGGELTAGGRCAEAGRQRGESEQVRRRLAGVGDGIKERG